MSKSALLGSQRQKAVWIANRAAVRPGHPVLAPSLSANIASALAPPRVIAAILLSGLLVVSTTMWAAGVPASSVAAPAANGTLAKTPAAVPAGRAAPAPQNSQPLGVLNSAGDVSEGTSNSAVPGSITIFAGDLIRTGEGMATFTAPNGLGSIVIFAQSLFFFSGDSRFLGELRAGRIGIRFGGGPNGIIVRAGNFVIVSAVAGTESSVTVERMADASFLITCTEGSIGVVPLAGGNGLFFQAGQSARITPAGELANLQNQGPTATNTPPPQPVVKKKSFLWLWFLLGGGAAAGTVAAILATRPPPPPVTPDSP